MKEQTINLFEFSGISWEKMDELNIIPRLKQDSFAESLESVLDLIWNDRHKYVPEEYQFYKSVSKSQRFIDLGRTNLTSRNWIGTIHFRTDSEEYTINLLPKIFYIQGHNYPENEIRAVMAHILWWLSGTEKQFYTSTTSNLEGIECDFLEILVYLFSSYTLDVFSSRSYHYYSTLSENLQTVRGHIDINHYIRNYSNGNHHLIPCVYDSFQLDNLFNRIVKFVAGMLKGFTRNPLSRRNFEEILFILDDVEAVEIKSEDCDKVRLNPIYEEFRIILDNCKLFLSSLSAYKWKDDYNVFALLIPSEKLFENFIFSILRKYALPDFREVSRNRPGRTYLVRQVPDNRLGRFKMINDIVIRFSDNKSIILDTKYKKISSDIDDNTDESDYNSSLMISQTDIYQMVSYAIGSNISEIGLIFPQYIQYSQPEKLHFEIDDELAGGITIRIYPCKVDIIHKDGLGLMIDSSLKNIFKSTEEQLANQLLELIRKMKEFELSVGDYEHVKSGLR